MNSIPILSLPGTSIAQESADMPSTNLPFDWEWFALASLNKLSLKWPVGNHVVD